MYKLAILGIFATAFLMTANMQIYIHSLRLGIYSWHIFVPVVPFQIALAFMLGNLLRLNLATRLFMLWWLLLLILMAVSLALVNDSEAAIARASQYTIIALMSMSFVAVTQQPALIKAGVYGIAAAITVAAGVSIAEFINPDFNMVVDQRYESRTREGEIQRVGGLYVNANLNARVMALGMFVCAFFLPRRLRLLFCLLIGAGVFTTVSRSGISTWIMAFVMLFVLGQMSSGRIMARILGLTTVVIVAAALSAGKIPEMLEAAGLDEYMDQGMMERLSSSFFSQEDDSTSGRRDLARHAIELYAENAFLGAGLNGSANLGETDLGPHNTMLEIAAELGTGGLLVYLGIFIIPFYMRSPKAGAYLAIYFFSSMFGHGLLAKPSLAFIIPAGIVLLSDLDHRIRNSSRRVRKKRKRRSRVSPKGYAVGQS